MKSNAARIAQTAGSGHEAASGQRTTYARAVAGYDEAFERVLLEAITRAIFDVSRTTDAHCVALRTGEMTSALLTMLATSIALSPAVTRSPTALRKTVDELGKRLRQKVAYAESSPDFRAFKDRIFHSDRDGGNA